MSRPPAQTTLYSLDRTQSLTASHAGDDRESVENTEKPTDAGAPGEHSSPEIEQDDGVTRIEALCKCSTLLYNLWMLTCRSRLRQGSRSLCSMGFNRSHRLCLLAQSKHHRLLYVHSISYLRSILTRLDVPFATSSFGEHTIIGTIGVINGVLNGVSQPFIAKVCLTSRLIKTLVNDTRLPTCGPDLTLFCWLSPYTQSATPCVLALRTSLPLSLVNSSTP
jgi:hypothetical protein